MKTLNIWMLSLLVGLLGSSPRSVLAQNKANVTQLIRDSQTALAEEKVADAERLARSAVDLDPAHPPAWRQYGLALLRGGKPKEAVDALQRTVSMDEKDATAWRGLGMACWQAKQENEAVRALSAYLRLKPEDASVWRDLATWMTKLQRGDQAIAALERVVELKPDDTSALRELGSWLTRQERSEAAVAVLERVVQAKPDDASAWRDLATGRIRLKQHGPAVAALERVVELKPDDISAWREMANELIRLERFEKAVDALERVVRAKPDDAASWRELAHALIRLEQREASVAALKKVTELKPDEASSWREMATGLTQLKQHEQAVDALEKAVNLNSADAAAWRELANGLIQLERHEKAVAALKKVTELKPDEASAWREMGTGLTQLDRTEQAVDALERAVKLQPDDAVAWRALALLYQRRGRVPEAVKALEQALAVRPDDPATRRDLGWILWTQGRREEGVEQLAKAVEAGVEARDRVIYQVVARLSEEGGGDKALAFLRRVSPQNPPSTLGLALARAGRLRAAEPLLINAWQTGEQTPDIGLYLAYSRAVNGQFADIEKYLEPVLSAPPPLATERADLALEALRLGNTRPEAPALVTRLESVLGKSERYSERVTAILETAAEASRARSDPVQALSLYRRVLDRDPDRSCWTWAVLMAERVEGKTPDAWLDRYEKRVSKPARLAGIKGLRADRKGRTDEAISALRQSLLLDPQQPLLRQMLFNSLLSQGRVAEARTEMAWFASQVEAGEAAMLRSYLAEMLTRLGDTREALAQWEMLHQTNPEAPYYGIETAHALYRLGRPDEAMEILKAMAGTRPNSRVFELMAEIASARVRTAEALEWASRGLAVAPSPALLRYHAESLEKLGTNAPAALASAQTFLKEDPGSVPMTLLAGRMLGIVGVTNEVETFYREQLARNPLFVPSLTALRDITTREGRIDEASEYARVRCMIQTNNAEALRAYANTLAQQDHFHKSLNLLRPLARKPLEQALPILVYQSISKPPYPGLNSVDQISRHVKRLADDGYVFVNAFSQVVATQNLRQVMFILVDPEPDVIEALDPVLQRHNARVVYAGNAACPALTLSGLPIPERLAPILASGRWQLASGGPAALRRQPVTETGVLGSPLTHPLMEGGSRESPEAFLNRLSQVLAESSRALKNQDERILVYPSGDFGQRSLDSTTNNLFVLREAMRQHFTHAVYFDDSGFYLLDSTASRLRIPSRNVPPEWDEAALATYLGAGHPLVRARLELARLLYWQGQHEAAHRAFVRAAEAGADIREMTFDWGMNSDRQGDIPTARARLRAALADDPESERIRHALERLEERRRPEATAFISGWRDNENRDHYRYGALGDAYVSERLRLGVMADRDRWSTDHAGSEYGTRYGLRGLAFLAPEIWLAGSLWQLDMDNLKDHWGGEAMLRLPNPWLSGYLMLVASREEIETVEALRGNIDADTFALRTYTRLLDNFDLFANLSQIDRSDGNDTTMLEGRLLYRLNEWPYAGAGWRFRFADSDRDPPEYWAPEQLQQHQAHVTVRGSWGRFSGSFSAEAGVAEEKDTSWAFVWGARGGGDIALTKRVSLSAELGYFESTDYNRTFGRLGLTGRF